MDVDIIIALIRDGDIDAFTNLEEKLLVDKKAYNYTKSFLATYKKFPEEKTLYADLDIPELDKLETPAYYVDRLIERKKLTHIREILNNASKTLKKDLTLDEGVDEVRKSLIALECKSERAGYLEISESALDRLAEYEERKAKAGLIGLSSPWEQLDEMTLGYCEGNVVIVVGPTEIGKSWFLSKQFEHSFNEGHRPLFVSVELVAKTVAMRVDAIYSKVDYAGLRGGKLDSLSEETYKERMEEMSKSEHKGWICDASEISSPDKLDYRVGQLQPNIVLLDGLYLLRSHMQKAQIWERMTEVVRSLQLIASKHKIPIIATSQFTRKIKKGTDKGGIEDIGYSHSIAQAADLGIALKQNSFQADNKQMEMEIIKGREFKKSAKGILVNWNIPHDFSFLELSVVLEDEEAPPEKKTVEEDEDDGTTTWE